MYPKNGEGQEGPCFYCISFSKILGETSGCREQQHPSSQKLRKLIWCHAIVIVLWKKKNLVEAGFYMLFRNNK
jgi:hypothetical protein